MPKKKGPEPTSVKEVIKPTDSEVICVVKRILGAEHVVVLCVDGKERVARIPGRLRKRIWIKEGDVVLAAPWDFQPGKCDIVYRYESDELKRLYEEKVVTRDVIDQLKGA